MVLLHQQLDFDWTLTDRKFSLICAQLKNNELSEQWDDVQKVPYAFNGSFWIGYDNIQSVTGKANYIMNSGACFGVKFPFIAKVHENFVILFLV